jgi:hypothetical protein
MRKIKSWKGFMTLRNTIPNYHSKSYWDRLDDKEKAKYQAVYKVNKLLFGV